jgi:hypothetical protein
MKKMPTHCPSCSEQLTVRRLKCAVCETEVEGVYPLPLISGLSNEEQMFVLSFIKASGSLKEMAAIMNVSYPTVRNKLNEIIRKIEETERCQGEPNE